MKKMKNQKALSDRWQAGKIKIILLLLILGLFFSFQAGAQNTGPKRTCVLYLVDADGSLVLVSPDSPLAVTLNGVAVYDTQLEQFKFIGEDLKITLDGEPVYDTQLEQFKFIGEDLKITLDGEVAAVYDTQIEQLKFVGDDLKMTLDGEVVEIDSPVVINLQEGTRADTTWQAIKDALELIDDIIAGSEGQVDIVAPLPAGSNQIGVVEVANAETPLEVASYDTHFDSDVPVTLGGEIVSIDTSTDIPVTLDGEIVEIDSPVVINLQEGTRADTTWQAIKDALELIDDIISGSEGQVDIVASLPAGANQIGVVEVANAETPLEVASYDTQLEQFTFIAGGLKITLAGEAVYDTQLEQFKFVGDDLKMTLDGEEVEVTLNEEHVGIDSSIAVCTSIEHDSAYVTPYSEVQKSYSDVKKIVIDNNGKDIRLAYDGTTTTNDGQPYFPIRADGLGYQENDLNLLNCTLRLKAESDTTYCRILIGH